MTTARQPPLAAAQAARADQIIDALARLWPNCFAVYERRRRPLAIGIDQALFVQLELAIRSGHVTETDVRLALQRYVGANGYLDKCIAGAQRVGIDGKPAGVVTEQQAARARNIVAKRAARRQANGNSGMRVVVDNESDRAGFGDAAARRVGVHDPVTQAS
jgi:ProP effector